MSSTASQKLGVARPAMESRRMIWSGHPSRYRAASTPKVNETIVPKSRPKNVSCMVTGSAVATRSETGRR